MYTLAWLLVALSMTWGLVSAQHSHSPYAGQEHQEIKALSKAEIEALRKGRRVEPLPWADARVGVG